MSNISGLAALSLRAAFMRGMISVSRLHLPSNSTLNALKSADFVVKYVARVSVKAIASSFLPTPSRILA